MRSKWWKHNMTRGDFTDCFSQRLETSERTNQEEEEQPQELPVSSDKPVRSSVFVSHLSFLLSRWFSVFSLSTGSPFIMDSKYPGHVEPSIHFLTLIWCRVAVAERSSGFSSRHVSAPLLDPEVFQVQTGYVIPPVSPGSVQKTSRPPQLAPPDVRAVHPPDSLKRKLIWTACICSLVLLITPGRSW